MIKLNVSAANIAVEEKETLTEGRVGLLCQFRFTDEWAGLAKTAVFDGADSRDVILKSDTVAVPAECLSAEGYSLSVGVYGKNSAGDIVIPTVYATVGKIQRSAYPSGKEPAEPTPDVVAQIQQAAANAEALARSVREDADLGKFQGAAGQKGDKGEKGDKGDKGDTGVSGGWYTPAVTQPEVNTLCIAFTPSKEDMPAVETAEVKLPGEGSVVIDDNLTIEGAAADAKATGDAINKLSDEIANLGDNVNVEVPENIALLEDVTVDEASGDFIPMLSPNGTEYRLSIGDDGIPIITNTSGSTVWSGTTGDSGGDSGDGSDSGDNSDWVNGAEIAYTVIEGEYPSKTDGAIISDPGGYNRTDYIYCYGADVLYTSGGGSWYSVFYDINKQFISNFNTTYAGYVSVPENAVYFVCSSSTLDGFVCKLYKNTEPTWTDGQAYSLSFVSDEYVDSTGAFVTYSGWKRTDYLNCVGASKISRTDGGETLNYCALYNTDKEFIKSFSVAGTKDITIPTVACYAVFSGENSVMDALALVPYA